MDVLTSMLLCEFLSSCFWIDITRKSSKIFCHALSLNEYWRWWRPVKETTSEWSHRLRTYRNWDGVIGMMCTISSQWLCALAASLLLQLCLPEVGDDIPSVLSSMHFLTALGYLVVDGAKSNKLTTATTWLRTATDGNCGWKCYAC